MNIVPSRRIRNGFTLIELLVVIAIIAILASILFPVFAQARAKARQSSCLSNGKQVSVGVLMYVQDYDETMPTAQWYVTWPTNAFGWANLTQPYVKNWGVYRCISATEDPHSVWSNSGQTQDYLDRWHGLTTNWGYNYNYLAPDPDCEPANTVGDLGSNGLPMGNVKKPAETVMFADTKNVGNDTDGWYGSNIAESPAILTVPTYCGYSNGGWGSGSYGDDAYGEGKPPTYTGDIALRHSGGTNVIFCDGHVKWMTPGNLAAGTNWKVGIANTDVTVTDTNKYLWDTE